MDKPSVDRAPARPALRLGEPSEAATGAQWLEVAACGRLEGSRKRERIALVRAVDAAAAAGEQKVIVSAARRLSRLNAHDRAAAAWRALLGFDPHHIEARNEVAEAELYDLAAGAAGDRRRIAMIGNCHVYPFAACLRRLLPDAEVRAVNIGAIQGDQEAAELGALYSGFDAVISHPLGPRRGALSSVALAGTARRFLLSPTIHFDGFHPDVLPSNANPRGLHSQLVVAGFVMGLAPGRVAELFNAYIYGVLGYFDAYAKAEAFLRESSRAHDFGFESLLPAWRTDGAFMHTPVHPSLRVFWSLAERAAEVLDPRHGARASDLADPLEALGVWPVYPEIARRLGMEGDLTFRLKDQPPMSLEAMIEHSFANYVLLNREKMTVSTAPLVKILRREGV